MDGPSCCTWVISSPGAVQDAGAVVDSLLTASSVTPESGHGCGQFSMARSWKSTDRLSSGRNS